jgi:ribosome-associated toxin RatA of RatAB toxin-antitoxin module
MKRQLAIGSLVVLGLLSGVASAQEKSARRYVVQTTRSTVPAGAATIKVNASIDVVRQVVTDFGNYANFIKRFEKAKVIGRHGDQTDVYLQVPILKGASKIWAVVRFDAPKPAANGNGEVIVGRMIKGNVKRLDARWSLIKVDEGTTNLDLEILLVPDSVIPIPDSLVIDESKYAAAKGVEGILIKSEQVSAQANRRTAAN